MKFFLDTANVAHVKEVVSWGVISGVTTNPSLVAREGREFYQVVREICQLVHGPVSAEVLSTEYAGMVAEARELSAVHPRVVIKIPVSAQGLQAVRVLTAEGIKTNVTLVFSLNQALLAARAGASYVSPFVGRLDDIGHEGMEIVGDIVEVFARYGLETKVIAASIRHPRHVSQAAMQGADIVTVPYSVLQGMLQHPLTDLGVERFLDDWKNATGN